MLFTGFHSLNYMIYSLDHSADDSLTLWFRLEGGGRGLVAERWPQKYINPRMLCPSRLSCNPSISIGLPHLRRRDTPCSMSLDTETSQVQWSGWVETLLKGIGYRIIFLVIMDLCKMDNLLFLCLPPWSVMCVKGVGLLSIDIRACWLIVYLISNSMLNIQINANYYFVTCSCLAFRHISFTLIFDNVTPPLSRINSEEFGVALRSVIGSLPNITIMGLDV
jgi:hypothetical protein